MTKIPICIIPICMFVICRLACVYSEWVIEWVYVTVTVFVHFIIDWKIIQYANRTQKMHWHTAHRSGCAMYMETRSGWRDTEIENSNIGTNSIATTVPTFQVSPHERFFADTILQSQKTIRAKRTQRVLSPDTVAANQHVFFRYNHSISVTVCISAWIKKVKQQTLNIEFLIGSRYVVSYMFINRFFPAAHNYPFPPELNVILINSLWIQ